MKPYSIILMLVAMALAEGCASSRQSRVEGSVVQGERGAVSQPKRPGYDYGQIANIQRAQTSEAQLLQWFGPPDNRTLEPNGRRHLAWDMRGGALQVDLGPDDKVASYAARWVPSHQPGQPAAYDDRRIAGIQRDETTKAQLVKWFGMPNFQQMKADGRGELAWNFGLGAVGGQGLSGELKLSLAPDGTVQSYAARRDSQ